MLLAVAAAAAGAAALCAPSYPPGRHLIEVDEAALGGHRQFLLVVPPEMPHEGTVPGVVSMHGSTENPYWHNIRSGTTDYAARYGWVAALPFGTAPNGRRGAAACCDDDCDAACCSAGTHLASANDAQCHFDANTDDAKDVHLVEYIIRFLAEHACVDTEHVFAMGFSNGGMTTNRLGCQAPFPLRAMAPVAGNIMLPPGVCAPERPTAWLGWCGSLDFVCTTLGTGIVGSIGGGFGATHRAWRDHNHCTEAEPVPTFQSATTECFAYQGCAASTEFCTISGLDHEWPGRDRPIDPIYQPPENIDATQYIFDRWSTMVPRRNQHRTNRTAAARPEARAEMDAARR